MCASQFVTAAVVQATSLLCFADNPVNLFKIQSTAGSFTDTWFVNELGSSIFMTVL